MACNDFRCGNRTHIACVKSRQPTSLRVVLVAFLLAETSVLPLDEAEVVTDMGVEPILHPYTS